GKVVRVACTTNYPFEESISLAIDVDAPAQFPLHLRIPAWCQDPTVRVNGQDHPDPQPKQFLIVDREWTKGDKVELSFPMPISTQRGANHAVSIRRGP